MYRFQDFCSCIAAPRGNPAPSPAPHAMPPVRSEVLIQGLTRGGRRFRPSDWAERLAGVMSQFRPGGAAVYSSRLPDYSPWCVPTIIGDVKCVVVDTALRGHEPMAWDFVMNFARDNDLQVSDACLLPEPANPSPAR